MFQCTVSEKPTLLIANVKQFCLFSPVMQVHLLVTLILSQSTVIATVTMVKRLVAFEVIVSWKKMNEETGSYRVLHIRFRDSTSPRGCPSLVFNFSGI